MCPPGYYCPEGTGYRYSNPCPVGFYRKLSAAVSVQDCSVCFSGHFCDVLGLENPKVCPEVSHNLRMASKPDFTFNKHTPYLYQTSENNVANTVSSALLKLESTLFCLGFYWKSYTRSLDLWRCTVLLHNLAALCDEIKGILGILNNYFP